MKGACYIKYMAASAERSYCTSYNGQDRGILIQFGQQQVCPAFRPDMQILIASCRARDRPATQVHGFLQVGHLPLGLFEPK